MSKEFFSVAKWHRLKEQFYKLTGSTCPDCGMKHFTPKAVCSCGAEIFGHLEGVGTIKAVIDKTGGDERVIEVLYLKNDKERKLSINLNGKSHSLKIDVNTRIGILGRKSRENGIVYDVFPISSSSK